MENILEVKNLSKEYKGFSLKDVNFKLERGYIMGFIGQNGAGKTTTIKLIMNLINRKSGEIKIFGLDNIKNEKEVKEKIGFVYDETYCYEDLSLIAMKNIIARFYKGWDDTAFNKYIADYITFINDGKIVFSDSKNSILEKYKIVKDFLLLDRNLIKQALLWVVFVATLQFLGASAVYIGIPVFMTLGFLLSSYGFSEKNNVDILISSLPVNGKEVVLSKLGLILVIMIFTFAYNGTVASYIMSFFSRPYFKLLMCTSSLVSSIIIVFITCFTINMFYSKASMIIYVLMPLFTMYLLVNLNGY